MAHWLARLIDRGLKWLKAANAKVVARGDDGND
jgi:hypothetical protein